MATATTWNGTQQVLLCRLLRHVVTKDGDFIPARTPVKVMGWEGNDKDGTGRTTGKIEVQTAAYMYADTFEYQDGDGKDRCAVGRGLYLSVDPDAIEFLSISNA